MALQVYRLRRLLAATAGLLVLIVGGMYFFARMRAIDVLKQFPGKIGLDIKQTATGYAELRNVSIVLYGRDSSRFDQISGDEFAYNQKTGDVIAKGDVQIDLVANPAGLATPDQTTPQELKKQ